MEGVSDLLLVVVLLMNFLILGSSEMKACLRAAAFQGVVLALLPPLLHPDHGLRVLLLVVGTAAIKGFLIPSLLFKAMRDAHIRHEVEPYIGFVPSLFLCALGTGLSVLFSSGLPMAEEHRGLLIVPASLAMLMSGFLVLTTRRKAITQVVGYLMLENGIFVFGLLLLGAMPLMVEVGVLLDLLVAIFVMGIVIHHIQREFSSLDTERLSGLREG